MVPRARWSAGTKIGSAADARSSGDRTVGQAVFRDPTAHRLRIKDRLDVGAAASIREHGKPDVGGLHRLTQRRRDRHRARPSRRDKSSHRE